MTHPPFSSARLGVLTMVREVPPCERDEYQVDEVLPCDERPAGHDSAATSNQSLSTAVGFARSGAASAVAAASASVAWTRARAISQFAAARSSSAKPLPFWPHRWRCQVDAVTAFCASM